jgi:hypothetical protein
MEDEVKLAVKCAEGWLRSGQARAPALPGALRARR